MTGYSQAIDNRSTFILFRHPEQNYLVQFRVGYDVTRTPKHPIRFATSCSERGGGLRVHAVTYSRTLLVCRAASPCGPWPICDEWPPYGPGETLAPSLGRLSSHGP
jgi:hypothetical protein